MNQKTLVKNIIQDLDFENVKTLFRLKSGHFTIEEKDFSEYKDEDFINVVKIGEFNFDTFARVAVFKLKINRNLSEKTSKKLQYQKAKLILKHQGRYKGGVFFFYDDDGNFRLSFVYEILYGNKRKFNLYKRFTYFVQRGNLKHKTFIQQIGSGTFESFEDIKEAFSVDKLSDEFYNSFEPKFISICNSLQSRYELDSEEIVKDFVLLFVIRIIFLGFIQKKKWLSESEKFLQEYWGGYKRIHYGKDKFYSDWLYPLFFKALNNPQGKKNLEGYNIPVQFKKILEKAPYLNGGLFDEHRHDDRGYKLLDSEFEEIFEYIYSYNFTIEENTLYDQELELNPEFLGIIFEKLVNKELGAVYTPRTEVDFMGRLTLVKWLYKNNTENLELRDLYELFFDEIETKKDLEEYQRRGSFSRRQQKHILELLEDIKICDPACGSGAFLVGMLQVIDEIEDYLRKKLGGDYILDPFERRKRIVFSSLFGVEVKEWAVWIAQLRLWITLFIEAPDSLRESKKPILPSLDFKIRTGDSLVQKVGNQIFSIKKFGNLGKKALKEVENLIELKRDYYDNKLNQVNPIEFIERKEKSFFTDLLNNEIKRIDIEIQNYKINIGRSESQASLFGTRNIKIALNQDEIQSKLNNLEKKRNELVSNLEVVNKQRPLVWIIEFADVFANPNKSGFDIVIGNPPYLRQEEITDPYGNTKGYKDLLIESIKGDFPGYFIDQNKRINKQSDLYTYFYVRSLALLNRNGFLTFICENSWLDVNYGAWLQEFVLNNAHLDLIIDNQAEKSFKEDVNTIITVLESTQRESVNDFVKFVNFKRPFEEVLFTEKLLAIAKTAENTRNNDYRINVLSRDELYRGGLEVEENTLKGSEYVGDKWGSKYLRAPEIYDQILQKGQSKLQQLSDLAIIKRGFTTGCNDFFYIERNTPKANSIEKDYLRPIIKSSQELDSIKIDISKLKYYVFLCNKNKRELLDSHALKYINDGERKEIQIKQGKDKGKTLYGYNKLSTVKSRPLWYSLNSDSQAQLFTQMSFNVRMPFFYSPEPVYADARLYSISPKSKEKCDLMSLCLSLNSTLHVIFIELIGRSNLGAGALDFKVYEANRLPVIYTHFKMNKITEDFISRKQQNIFEECGFDINKPLRGQKPSPLRDRAYIDSKIFDTLGLLESERNEVYWAACELVYNRVSKSLSK